MAKLQEMGVQFTSLNWPDKVAFMEAYRERRNHDLTAVQDFNLKKQAKTKSTKARTPKDPNAPARTRKKKDEVKVTHEQLSLLRQLGINV